MANLIAHNLVSMPAAPLAQLGARTNCGIPTLRHWLFEVPGRVLRSGLRLYLRRPRVCAGRAPPALYQRTCSLPMLARRLAALPP